MSDKGLVQGLAYRHDFSGAVSNYQREDALERARRSEQMAQTKMLFEGIPDAPQVMGSKDREMISSKYQGLFEELAQFAKDNPNYTTDPEQAAKRYELSKSIQNDPAILRAISSTEQYNQMMAFQKDNPELTQTPDFINSMAKWEMYSKHGSTDGVNESGFTFINPAKRINVEDYIAQTSKGMVSDDYGLDQHGTYAKVSDGVLNEKAWSMLNDGGVNGYAIKAQYNDLKQQGKIPEGMSAQEWLSRRLRQNYGKPRVKNPNGTGEGGEDTKGLAHSEYGNLYKYPVSKGRKTALEKIIPYNSKNESITFEDGFVMLPDSFNGDAALLTGGNGNFVGSESQTFYESIMNHEMRAKVTGNTIRLGRNEDTGLDMIGVEVVIDIPYLDNGELDRQFVEELVKNGMIENDDLDIIWWGTKDIDGGEGDLTPRSKNIFFGSRTNDKGENEKVLKVKGYVPSKFSEANQMEYDSEVQGQSVNRAPKQINVPTSAVVKFAEVNGRYFMLENGKQVEISKEFYLQNKK